MAVATIVVVVVTAVMVVVAAAVMVAAGEGGHTSSANCGFGGRGAYIISKLWF